MRKGLPHRLLFHGNGNEVAFATPWPDPEGVKGLEGWRIKRRLVFASFGRHSSVRYRVFLIVNGVFSRSFRSLHCLPTPFVVICPSRVNKLQPRHQKVRFRHYPLSRYSHLWCRNQDILEATRLVASQTLVGSCSKGFAYRLIRKIVCRVSIVIAIVAPRNPHEKNQ